MEDDDSDEGTVSSGESLLVRPLPPTHLTRFRPIYTGYISLIEVIVWVSCSHICTHMKYVHIDHKSLDPKIWKTWVHEISYSGRFSNDV